MTILRKTRRFGPPLSWWGTTTLTAFAYSCASSCSLSRQVLQKSYSVQRHREILHYWSIKCSNCKRAVSDARRYITGTKKLTEDYSRPKMRPSTEGIVIVSQGLFALPRDQKKSSVAQIVLQRCNWSKGSHERCMEVVVANFTSLSRYFCGCRSFHKGCRRPQQKLWLDSFDYFYKSLSLYIMFRIKKKQQQQNEQCYIDYNSMHQTFEN